MHLGTLLNGLSVELEPIKQLALRLAAADGKPEVQANAICLSHRPRVAPKAFALRLYAPVREQTIKQYEKIHNLKVSSHYRPLLREINGVDAFEFSLFGIPPSMAKSPPLLDRSTVQPYDLSCAQRWRLEYAVEGDLFHFGGGPSSHGKNLGYFFDEAGVIYAFRKNGTSIGSWDSFGSFLADELKRAEQAYPEHESFMAELQKHETERKPTSRRKPS